MSEQIPIPVTASSSSLPPSIIDPADHPVSLVTSSVSLFAQSIISHKPLLSVTNHVINILTVSVYVSIPNGVFVCEDPPLYRRTSWQISFKWTLALIKRKGTVKLSSEIPPTMVRVGDIGIGCTEEYGDPWQSEPSGESRLRRSHYDHWDLCLTITCWRLNNWGVSAQAVG